MTIEMLFQALAEMSLDQSIFGQELYDYLVERDGFCPLTPDEIMYWLNDFDCFE